MNTPLGRFKVWDMYAKKIISEDIAYIYHDDLATIARIDQDDEGLYLHSIGRRDRYVIIPELPRLDLNGDRKPLWVGDVLSKDDRKDNLWVIRFDLMRGVYSSLIGFPDSFYQVDDLIEQGLCRVGDIFEGIVLNSGENYVAKVTIDPNEYV